MKRVLILAAAAEAATGVALLIVPSLVGRLLLYLAYVGFAGGLTGILLWPAVVLHVILTALLTQVPTKDKEMKNMEAS